MAENINMKSPDKKLGISFGGEDVTFSIQERQSGYGTSDDWAGAYATIPLPLYNSKIRSFAGTRECSMSSRYGGVRIQCDEDGRITMIEVSDPLRGFKHVGSEDFEIYLDQLT